MRPVSDIRRAQALVEAGWPLLTVAKELGISRAAIRDWRDRGFNAAVAYRQYRHDASYGGDRQGLEVGPPGSHPCGAEDRAARESSAYAYLLGQYLGDGTISLARRGVYKLRIFCCSDYPGIIGRVIATARALVPGKVSGYKTPGVRLVVVTTHWKHMPCLFPQHGPGRKHERFICLADWQNEIVLAHPKRFLRGLIESDGCRSVNWVKGNNDPRYMFANVSDDIRRLCCRTLDQLGVHWTTANARNIAVSRRPDVAYLDSFIGPKR